MLKIKFKLVQKNWITLLQTLYALFSRQRTPQRYFYSFQLSGFQKFQRKSKIQQEESTQPKEEKKATEKPNQEEAEKIIKDEQSEGDLPPKIEKPQKKKYQFTYDPKSFNPQDENQKKEKQQSDQEEKVDKQENQEEKQEKQENQEEEQQQQSQQQEKKKSQFPQIDFSKFTEYLKNPNNRNYIYMFLGVTGLASLYTYLNMEEEITYTEFLKNYLETNQVSSIKVYNNDNSKINQASIITNRGESKKLILGNVDHFLENLERYQTEKGVYPEQFIPVSFEIQSNEIVEVGIFGFSRLLYLQNQLKGSIGSLGKGGGNDVFGFGKSNVKQFGFEQNVKVKFNDVAGLDEAKLEIKEFVDFLKKPRKFKEMGAKLPRGALLAGPPGTGKTMVAKACAGEAGVPFFFVSGSDFVEMFVGVGASRVRDLFKQAKAKSPSIIFIDEIDAVGRKRNAKIGGNDERDNTLNQLLVEMDGFGTDTNVIVLAATNRKELLDPALTRPGRFDRSIDITLPDIEGRKQIFMVHLAPIKLDPSKTMEEYARRLATLTPGFSGAEIANLCNEAAIMAARANKTYVDSHDFEMASERVMAGLEKRRIISEEERKTVAFHESGHAVASWFLKGGHPLLKLTIIPRSKGSLGYAQYLPNESSLETKQELLDRICCILGGRVAEEIFFGQVTTGAYDDLKKAYDVAHSIVTKFGMNENIGYVGFQEGEFQKPYSDGTNKQIDDEIRKLIEEQTQRTRLLITEKKEFVNKLASTLLEKETLDLQKIIEVLGERPFPPKSNYKAYLEIKKEDQQTTSQ
ncbi:unnamed protein product (macronuclear) [Paramecium tetraurelia]|uniref:AAA+ ATPase domain-containing protein n=1 Tax=Paramecium tetraurelia TaxID=5888 RepID=A0CMV3_PARTE|nr:uncharacterized protein GSPATT00038737001 [Paramecium tetraurelia]CAK72120.1 unnamed protein product [Paramecium tetraurelia]|eukprot:XP_001439517.1 hypothetical protein (macronuclear) [Paramecium tetraurelia strain d4-2]